MRILILLSFILIAQICDAQQSIDNSFAFQNDPAKRYSLFVPSSYVPGDKPVAVMLALHPLNTARWDSKSWRDTLIAFAEANDLLLVCPDGGNDGRIDDPIDTAFTTALLDSIQQWYTINPRRIYVMGFSWGGRATYTYGLANAHRFAGFLPIGAAITETDEVNLTLQTRAAGKPVFIIHGTADQLSVRYEPIRAALVSQGAIVNSLLLSGVGHTIDFTERNELLRFAYRWLDSVATANSTSSVTAPNITEPISLPHSTTVQRGQLLRFPLSENDSMILLCDVLGRTLLPDFDSFRDYLLIHTEKLPAGIYFLQVNNTTRTVIVAD